MTNSLFEPHAIRMGRLTEERQRISSTLKPRIQTDDSSRLNAHLINLGHNQDRINELITAYDFITNAKRQLGIKGE